MGHLNIQSLVPKLNQLKLFLEEKKFDILAISETWLNDQFSSRDLMMDGYNLIRKDRSFGRGGGVLLYVFDKFKYDVIATSCDIEQLFVKVVYNRYSFVAGVVYKPLQTSYKYFIDSLETSFTLAMSYADNIFCTGDVNVNFLNKDCVGTNYFNSVLSPLEMNRMITHATHMSPTSESLIDVLMCSNESLVTSVFVLPS
nr:unnamed protein product [Callosobruchus chinensis]